MSGITYNREFYTFDLSRDGLGNDNRVLAHAWALESALKCAGFDLEVGVAGTNSTYIRVLDWSHQDTCPEIDCEACHEGAREYIVRVANHQARGNCDANLVLGVEYVDSAIATIVSNITNAQEAIDAVMATITTWKEAA